MSPAVAPLDNALPNQYCIGCHNQRAKTAGLMLDSMDYSNIGKDAATWEKVVRKIKTGMMPPSGARRPERAALDAFASDIEKRLDATAAIAIATTAGIKLIFHNHLSLVKIRMVMFITCTNDAGLDK